MLFGVKRDHELAACGKRQMNCNFKVSFDRLYKLMAKFIKRYEELYEDYIFSYMEKKITKPNFDFLQLHDFFYYNITSENL